MVSFFRLIYVAIAAFIAKISFEGIYVEFQTGLPDVNKPTSLPNKNISDSFYQNYEMWNKSFEKSLMYSSIIFLLALVILEYINLGKVIVNLFSTAKDDLKYIKEK